MNSADLVLKGFEWEYNGPISIMAGTGYDGKGISRTMFLAPKLEELPEQLFAVKLSQSKNPQKAGRFIFKYLSFRFNPDDKFQDFAPTGIDMQTQLADIKSQIITKLGSMPNTEVSLGINMNGKFANIQCSDGLWAIYDEDKFPNADPNKVGKAPYYIKPDAIIHVKLKGAISATDRHYLQSELSTSEPSSNIFQKMETGKVWGADDSGAADGTIPVGGAPDAGDTPPAAPSGAVW